MSQTQGEGVVAALLVLLGWVGQVRSIELALRSFFFHLDVRLKHHTLISCKYLLQHELCILIVLAKKMMDYWYKQLSIVLDCLDEVLLVDVELLNQSGIDLLRVRGLELLLEFLNTSVGLVEELERVLYHDWILINTFVEAEHALSLVGVHLVFEPIELVVCCLLLVLELRAALLSEGRLARVLAVPFNLLRLGSFLVSRTV